MGMMTLFLCAIDDVLVNRLGDRSVEAREEATAALLARGIVPHVHSDDPEVAGRIELIARELPMQLMRREIARPFDLDLPPVFERLLTVRGYAALIPALEERARATTDPTVRSVCERAIRFQKEDPCSPSP